MAALVLAASFASAAAAPDAALREGAGVQWGGVAELRHLSLRPAGGPTASVMQGALRLTAEHRFDAGPGLVAHVQGEWLRASDGSTLARLPSPTASADRAVKLGYTRSHARRSNSLGFDWLYLQGAWAKGRYTVGRQPIAPSIGRLWSPADTFAPFHPNDMERLYKPGVDAAQVSYFAAERLALSTIMSTDRRGGRVRRHWQQRAELEAPWGKAFALAGQRRAQKLAGGGMQVNGVAGTDLHAEMLWHRGPQALAAGTRQGLRTVLGASRRIGADTTGTLEFFHQSRGISEPARYDAYSLASAGIDLPFMGVGRRYGGLAINSQLHPLLTLDLLLLANLGDQSAASTAALAYTPLPDLKLRSAVTLPVAGGNDSEYGRAGGALQLGLQWFF